MANRTLRLEEMKVLEINSSYLGVPALKLMENAGQAVSQALQKEFKKAKSVAVLCGRGNNGGDGFVTARYLSTAGLSPAVFLVERGEDPATEISKSNLSKIGEHLRPIEEFRPKEWDVIVDAMLGVGVRGKPREPYVSMIRKLNQSRRPVLSVDVPSGWPSSTAVRPTVTVTFHAIKAGMDRKRCGKIVVADIGIPEEAEMFVGPGEFVYYQRPRKASHKGDNGRVLVVGGGPFTGAPALAGMGAMFSGADLAHVAVPKAASIPVACYSPNLIVHPLTSDVLVPEDVPVIERLFKKCDALVIGPGLGDDQRSASAAAEVIKRCPLPMVIDADALIAVKRDPSCLRKKRAILTPHRGEFKKLTGLTLSPDLNRRSEQVSQAAKKMGATMLVKGPIDMISDGIIVSLNRTGNDSMTVGGTGDILAGICGCLLAKGMDAFHAARLASFMNGVSGDVAFLEKGYGLLSTDVASKIPYVLRRYL